MALLGFRESRIRRGKSPAGPVGMQDDLGPVRIINGRSRSLKLRVANRPPRIPDLPDIARECVAMAADQIRTAVQCHLPVIPVILNLLQGERLDGIVGAPSDRKRGTMGDAIAFHRLVAYFAM